MSPDGRPAFLSPPARRRQSRVWPDRAHRQKHRWPGPDYPRSNSHLTAREITCSDCGLRQRQSASSNPPAESLKNHIIEGVFTQPGRLCKNVFPPPKTTRNRGRSASIRRSEHIFALSSPESTRVQARATLSDLKGHTMRITPRALHARIATRSGLMPTMFITRVRL